MLWVFVISLFSLQLPCPLGQKSDADWSRWIPHLSQNYRQQNDQNVAWFPFNPSEGDTNPIIDYKKVNSNSNVHGIQMGIQNPECDDGKTNLLRDWDESPINYTCFEDKRLFKPHFNVAPLHSVEHIPKEYSAMHKCMNESIEYSEAIPTFGTHRPLWPVYGEYKFVPRQRWLHNLEHGAIVMLYHPCADPNQIKLLKNIVKSCLYRFVITPYNLLSTQRPLALVSWGHRLEMSKVSVKVAVEFIREHALKGPEQMWKEGQYDLFLTEQSRVVSTIEDSTICPQMNEVIRM